MQSEKQNETIEIEKEERQTEYQNEEKCSKNIEQNNLGQSSIKSFTTPASKLKSTSQHTPPTPPSREEKKRKKSNG